MKYKEYISTHQLFTTEELLQVTSAPTADVLLNRSLKAGDIERVRRGLYVSKTGKYYGETPDPFAIVHALDAEGVLAYHSALEVHGVAHSSSNRVAFRTGKVRSTFSYSGITYVPLKAAPDARTQMMHGKAFGRVLATTKEQTLVDCLDNAKLAGGIEEVLRSASAFPYMDFCELEALTGNGTAALAARLGWVLEAKQAEWNVPESLLHLLESRLKAGPQRLDPGAKESAGWSKRWKLYLPAPEEEMLSWLI